MAEDAADEHHAGLAVGVDVRHVLLHHRHRSPSVEDVDVLVGTGGVVAEPADADRAGPDRWLHDDVPFARRTFVAGIDDLRRHDRDSARRQLQEVTLVDVPLDELRWVPQCCHLGDAARPVQELFEVGVVVPRRTDHDGAERRPIDGGVVPPDDPGFRQLGDEQREVGVERTSR